MVKRSHRRNTKKAWENAQQRFIKQKRRNLLAQPGPKDLVIVLDGLKPNYNIGKIFRSADAFGVKKIHLVNIDFFDPAPAKGSFRYVPAVFDTDFVTCYQKLKEEGYQLIIFNPQNGKPLQDTPLPQKSAFVFGHEEFGFSFDPAEHPDLLSVNITQVGRVESLNVSVAASIAMYEYTRQFP